MHSEQCASILPLLALALFIGSQIEIEPIDNSQRLCQRWFEYQERGEDGRAKWNYEKECWG